MLLNVTWDVESFVFWDYDILDLICVILINGLKTYYVIWAEMLLWWMGWLFERVEIWWASLMGLKIYGLKCTLAATLAMSSQLSMSAPHHRPCQCHIILFVHVNGHVIGHVTGHVDIVWRGNWIRDVNFRHRKRAWVGFLGPGTFYDGFETSWIKQSMTKI